MLCLGLTHVYNQVSSLGWVVVSREPLLKTEHTGRGVLFQLGEEQGPGMRLVDSDQMGGHTKV